MEIEGKRKEAALAHLEDLIEAYRNATSEMSAWEEEFVVSLWEKFEKYKDRVFLSEAQANKIDDLWEKHI